MIFGDIYRGKRVLLTGHTGFKGSWLAEWLIALGAEVTGFSLPPATSPALFDQLGLANRLTHLVGDVRDHQALCKVIAQTVPDFVFHLAAQPLVRLSYSTPVETYTTNVMGTVHVLDAVRLAGCPCSVVAVTTDKCYENKEWLYSYREDEAMGGYDPYSSSKGAAELVISAYRRSYFSAPNSPIQLASARAGNVIGGGDWALDRILPDCIRALREGTSIAVRNKVATRPWQHVLEPLSGYLWLGARLAQSAAGGDRGAGALRSGFNFGPAISSNRTVADVVTEVVKHWPGQWTDQSDPNAVHEATMLNLATDKAYHLLQWQPVWNFEKTIEQTVTWYKQTVEATAVARALTSAQIAEYTAAATARHIAWAVPGIS